MEKPEEKSQASIKDCQEAYREKIRKETKNVHIVFSERAGEGKTTFIKEHSAKHNCTQQVFLPLSGAMQVAVDEKEGKA